MLKITAVETATNKVKFALTIPNRALEHYESIDGLTIHVGDKKPPSLYGFDGTDFIALNVPVKPVTDMDLSDRQLIIKLMREVKLLTARVAELEGE